MGTHADSFPALQSGFIGLNERVLELPSPIEPTVRQSVIFKEFKPPLLTYYYSREITEVFNRWSANKDAMKEMAFRERLLKATFQVFGTKVFREWLFAQINHAELSGLHQKFLLETLQYVLQNKERPVQNIQWINMLEAGPVTKSVRVHREAFKEAPSIADDLYSSVGTQIPPTVAELVQIWVSKRQGFEDLLVTMYTIFGERSRQTDAVDLNF